MLSKAPVTTILPVIDMSRAREFYERKLGLKPIGFAADGNFVFACAGEATIALIQKPDGTHADQRLATGTNRCFLAVCVRIEVDRLEVEQLGQRARAVLVSHRSRRRYPLAVK